MLAGRGPAPGEHRRVAKDSHCSLERRGRDERHYQTPCVSAAPSPAPLMGPDRYGGHPDRAHRRTEAGSGDEGGAAAAAAVAG